jgi:hypothetical protein
MIPVLIHWRYKSTAVNLVRYPTAQMYQLFVCVSLYMGIRCADHATLSIR